LPLVQISLNDSDWPFSDAQVLSVELPHERDLLSVFPQLVLVLPRVERPSRGLG